MQSYFDMIKRKNYFTLVSSFSTYIKHEMESVDKLNDLYRFCSIPVKIKMNVYNDPLFEFYRNGRIYSPEELDILFDLEVITAIPRFMAFIKNRVGSDIAEFVNVEKKANRRIFTLKLNGIHDRAVIDDLFDAIYDATEEELERRHKG